MSSVERSNSGHEEDLELPIGSSSSLKSPEINRSSISDKLNTETTPAKEKKTLDIHNSGDSARINSDFELEKEWQNLLIKLKGWIGTRLFLNEYDLFIDPSLLIIGLIALLIFLKAYTTILNTVEVIPLAPRLCQVIGTLWLIKFSTTRLLRKQDRQKFLLEMISRWRTFLGQSEAGMN